MAAYQTQQIDVGSIAAPEVGKVFTDFADKVQKQQAFELYKAQQLRQEERQQILNQRADQEWNREIGLRDSRKKVASEFTANPYAASWGSGKETADLDKKVIDYVNSGGVIDENMARNLQARYEEARPFREDASNAIASRLISMGEDPTRAKQEAESLTSSMIGRADMQARLDAQRQAQQKVYDDEAKAKLEALKLGIDVNKANLNSQTDMSKAQLNANTDLAKLKWQAGLGGGVGGKTTGGAFGGDWYAAQKAVEDMNFGSKDTHFDAKPFLETARSMGYTPNQAVYALKQGADIGIWDKSFDIDKSKEYLQKFSNQGGFNGFREVAPTAQVGQIGFNVNAADLMPKYAPRQIAGYDPEGFLEGSRSTLPELFKNDPVVTEKVDRSVIGYGKPGSKGNTLADRNFNPGNIKFDKNTKWEGGSEGEKGFVKFDTPELGARGLGRVVTNNIGTPINEFITKYAPPYENDTTNYIAGVVKSLGKKPTDKIERSDVLPLMKVITKIEGGSFTDEQLKAGYDLIDKYPVSGAKPKSEISKEILNPQKTDVKPTSSPKDMSNKINTGVTGTKTKLAEGQKLDRLAEIDSILGSNPAPTPENIALINERESLIPKSGIGSFLNKVNREIINPLGAMLPATRVTAAPKVVDNVLSKLGKSAPVASKSDDINSQLMREIFDTTPLAKVRRVGEDGRYFTPKITSEIKNKMIDEANKIRGIKNPTLQELERLQEIQEILRSNRSIF